MVPAQKGSQMIVSERMSKRAMERAERRLAALQDWLSQEAFKVTEAYRAETGMSDHVPAHATALRRLGRAVGQACELKGGTVFVSVAPALMTGAEFEAARLRLPPMAAGQSVGPVR